MSPTAQLVATVLCTVFLLKVQSLHAQDVKCSGHREESFCHPSNENAIILCRRGNTNPSLFGCAMGKVCRNGVCGSINRDPSINNGININTGVNRAASAPRGLPQRSAAVPGGKKCQPGKILIQVCDPSDPLRGRYAQDTCDAQGNMLRGFQVCPNGGICVPTGPITVGCQYRVNIPPANNNGGGNAAVPQQTAAQPSNSVVSHVTSDGQAVSGYIKPSSSGLESSSLQIGSSSSSSPSNLGPFPSISQAQVLAGPLSGLFNSLTFAKLMSTNTKKASEVNVIQYGPGNRNQPVKPQMGDLFPPNAPLNFQATGSNFLPARDPVYPGGTRYPVGGGALGGKGITGGAYQNSGGAYQTSRVQAFPGRTFSEGSSSLPGGLSRSQTPQFVYFTFDDAVTVAGSMAYQDLFNAKRRNPNGCRITATLFVSNEYTSYKEVRKLYNLGFEIADHSVSHRTPTTWWKNAKYDDLKEEFVGMREIESKSTGIPRNHILGVRVPFLARPPALHKFLKENHFGYDSTVTNTGTPIWPYKDDSGLWELPLNVWRDKNTGCGGMIDGCRPKTKEDTLTFLRENYRRHNDAPDKPPLGISMHSAWFLAPEWKYRKAALNEFLDELLANPDVWIVTPTQLLIWMESPVSKDKLYNYRPFQCQSRGRK